jgi:hypothetical protein
MLDYGEIAYAHTSPFQADMLPGEILQVEKKLFYIKKLIFFFNS